MKHTFYATKDIYPADVTIGKGVKPLVGRGEIMMIIDTAVELDRAIAAIHNGAATLDKPVAKPAGNGAEKTADGSK